MNRKDDINLVISRSEKSLKAAQILLQNELYADSISDSYYAMFHAVTACLHTIDVTVKTHSSVASYFTLNFVKTNLINSPSAIRYAKALKERIISDYSYNHNATKEKAEEIYQQSIALTNEIKTYLRQNNYLK